MLDIGHDFKQIDPNWFDTHARRPSCRRSRTSSARTATRSPACARAGSASKRRRRPTLGELKTIFEFELFGTGVDAGQTTFRLRHAYGELGHVRRRPDLEPVHGPDVFPNSLEYWGPTGMVFFRNVQVRWMPIQGDTRPDARARAPGRQRRRRASTPTASSCRTSRRRFPLPDLSGEYTLRRQAGATSEVAGILREIKWDDVLDDQFDLSGSATGWGINLSSNLKFGKNERASACSCVYRRGHPELHERLAGRHRHRQQPRQRRVTPIIGKPLPIVGIVAFFDHTWNEKCTQQRSATRVRTSTTREGQAPDAFKTRPVRARQPALLARCRT